MITYHFIYLQDEISFLVKSFGWWWEWPYLVSPLDVFNHRIQGNHEKGVLQTIKSVIVNMYLGTR